MADRMYFLQFDEDNNLLWTKAKEPPTKTFHKANKPNSVLNISVADGDVLTLIIGDSMGDWYFWKNPQAKYDWPKGKNEAISIKNGVKRGGGLGANKNKGEFEIIASADRVLIVQHIKSKTPSPANGNIGAKFDFDLHVVNKTTGNTGNKETRIIIDPIINNDGKGIDPP